MSETLTVEQQMIKNWRSQASAYMARIRRVEYADQQHRVEMYNIAKTLRYCATALYNATRKASQPQ